MNLAFQIVWFVFVNQTGIGMAGISNLVVGRKHPDIHTNQLERRISGHFIDRDQSRHGFTPVAHPAAGQRKFAAGNGQNAERLITFISSDHGDDTRQGSGRRDVHGYDLGVTVRTAVNAPDQRPGIRKISRVPGTAGDFFDAVYQRRRDAYCRVPGNAHVPLPCSAAKRTDSMIFT